MQSPTRETCVFSGAGAGKTHFLAAWAVVQAFSFGREDGEGIIAASTTNQLRIGVMATIQRFSPAWGVTARWIENRKMLYLTHEATGVTRVARTMSTSSVDPNRGANAPWLAVDELRELSRYDYTTVLLMRTRTHKNSKIMCVTTPNGFDWAHEYFVREPAENVEIATRRGVVMFGNTRSNTFLDETFFQQQADSLDPLMYKQEAEGLFVNTSEGQAYTAFRRERNMSDDYDYVPGLPVVVSFDFGAKVSAVVGQVHGGAITFFDELELPGDDRPASERVAQAVLDRWHHGHFPTGHSYAQRWRKEQACNNWVVTGDAMGNYRASSSRFSDYELIKNVLQFPPRDSKTAGPGVAWRMDMRVHAANGSVADRVATVNGLLGPVSGHVRMLINTRCKNLARDFEQVTWSQSGTDLQKSNKLDRLTHFSDAAGYAAIEHFPSMRDKRV